MIRRLSNYNYSS